MDCFQLKNAGDVARQKGILEKGKVLKCPFTNCDRVNCKLVENPSVKTIYITSAQISTVTPINRFYKRLEKYFEIKYVSR